MGWTVVVDLSVNIWTMTGSALREAACVLQICAQNTSVAKAVAKTRSARSNGADY